jgi:cell division protein FtsZ
MADRAGQQDQGLDDVMAAVRAFTSMMHRHGLVSLDYADIRAFCLDADGLKGRAVHGEGEAEGEGRAVKAAEAALLDLRRQIGP